MQIEKHNELVKLFDIYGKLLSNKQHDVTEKVLNFDIGVSELAKLDGESRQSIHDAVSKATKQLYIFEEKCEVLKNYNAIYEKLVKLKRDLEHGDTEELSNEIDSIIDKLK